MLLKCRKMLRNEKGLTLIELLAVVVILGIIAAIAIPSIGGLIDNSRKDAHAANAQQMISSSRVAITGSNELALGKKYLTLNYLEKNGYIEKVKAPDNKDYTIGVETLVENTAPTTGSYVEVTDGKITAVKLISDSITILQTSSTGTLTITRDHVTKN
ncbi:prepilin-type N-terminal cleavage/methylation domain-containing protein [Sutcliffiella horikoshii]|uniref:prepilin-type N-terminal cleavage/methylation domain-containing protein n=1 Tax=Sutcliffiella horikoshii TaxID=79883 RepID=UPI0020420A43|nr:prepilin-type N-terminal cleavage/methylation domain-containing protein [Sutcliffiella horikoshii]MCM3619316.1 prepilin-type N-terminal cleavage/methylation domain-containing protein [Sutcliffiella horikoshii]